MIEPLPVHARPNSVDLSTDGGRTRQPAELGPAVDQHAWCSWQYRWQAQPGEYELCVRAGCSTSQVQPVEQPWNRQGMANTMAQRVPVTGR